MADAPNLYLSSFGGLRLWISKLSTNKSRDIVVHDLTAGDDHVVQDRGRALLHARATVLFDYMDGDDIAPLDRLRKLTAMVDDNARMFAHPAEGSYLARVGPFNYEVDENSNITAEIEFFQVAPVAPVAAASAGAILAPGDGTVATAADDMTNELAELGITSPIPAQASAASDSWATSDGALSPRNVTTTTGSLTSDLGDQADELEGDIGAWQAFKATVILAESIRMAASAATAQTAQTFALRIGAPIALRALLVSVYPADQADDAFDAAMAINDIAAPAWIEIGTVLQLPQPKPVARSA